MHAHEIPEQSPEQLRRFGWLMAGMVAVLFGLAFPWLHGHAFPAWPWLLAVALLAFAVLAPRALRPVYRGWMRLGVALGRITTPIVLAVIFYVVLTPMALVMRAIGSDPLLRRFDRGAPSYRVPSTAAPSSGMERPF